MSSFRVAVVALLMVAAQGRGAEARPLREIIAQADLRYVARVERSEDGMPIGNGRMGSLAWATPTALRLQINRVDVQPMGAAGRSFFERNSDYMGGCGFVDLDLGGAGGDVFTKEGSVQHLSVYDGLLTIAGPDVTVRAVALPDSDVFAIEIDDRRPQPQPLALSLRMLRHAAQYSGDFERQAQRHINTVRTRQHTAASQLHVRGDAIALTQEFQEAPHVARSALAMRVMGRAGTARVANETTATISVPAARGRVLVLIASAASVGGAEGELENAHRVLQGAAERTFEAHATDAARWWGGFWARGGVVLQSADGVAAEVAAQYHYFLYIMAASSRGKFPPKFNGMLWNTAGDLRTWGAQHWFANLSCYYEPLFAANRLELLDPMFDMYSGMLASAAMAARQQWGSEGIFIPETVWFDGLATLPDDIAAEMRELYLMRKPWAGRSARFLEYAATQHPHSSRWNWWGGGSHVEGRWRPTERGNGPYGPVTHILGTTAKVAYLYWRRYEYTLDRDWLKERAYPMLRGAAEFYRHFPNLRRDERGVWHIHHTNSNESVQDVRDSDEDLSAMRGVWAAAVRAATLLDTDAPLRSEWARLLAGLAPLPTSADPDAVKPADYAGPAVFVRGRTPVVVGRGFTPDGNSLPQWFFDLCNPDATEPERLAVANATFDRALRGAPPNAETRVGVLSKLAIAGATLGRVEAVRHLVPNQMKSLAAEREGAYGGGRPLANRLSLREGHQAFDVQRLGRAAEALQIGLLTSAPPGPAEPPIVRVFAAWPPEWEARFTLRARGGFVVTAAQRGGVVEFVEVRSEAGETLRLRNPWPGSSVRVMRENGDAGETAEVAEMASGEVLVIRTRRGERVRVEGAEGLKAEGK